MKREIFDIDKNCWRRQLIVLDKPNPKVNAATIHLLSVDINKSLIFSVITLRMTLLKYILGILFINGILINEANLFFNPFKLKHRVFVSPHRSP